MSGRIALAEGDITGFEADVIVTSANSSLLGGGGVDGAIHRAGGAAVAEECRLLGWCEVGEAKATTAGNLPARYVIHTVGPVWEGGEYGEEGLLEACHRNSVALAAELGCVTVAFPAISTGVYDYPIERAAAAALRSTAAALSEHPQIELVTFVLFDRTAFAAFETAGSELPV